MTLTANDVLNKRFEVTRSREGYAQEEVDTYLDEVVAAMRALEARVSAVGAAGDPADLDEKRVAAAVAPRSSRVEELERENAYLRGELEAARRRLAGSES